MTYQPIPIDPTLDDVEVRDLTTHGLLEELLKAINRLNFHLALITGAEVSVEEAEGD